MAYIRNQDQLWIVVRAPDGENVTEVDTQVYLRQWDARERKRKLNEITQSEDWHSMAVRFTDPKKDNQQVGDQRRPA